MKRNSNNNVKILFQSVLTLSPKRARRFESACIDLHQTRPCSTGKQVYTADTSLRPLNEPIAKFEATVSNTMWLHKDST